jgi:hypothetical protein
MAEASAMPLSIASPVLGRSVLGKVWRLAARSSPEPLEHKRPGELLHV